MPIIKESGYKRRPLLYFNSYLETLVPYFTTKVNQVKYERERLELSDGDFLDLDWKKSGGSTLMLISHGFEGNAKDHFIEKSTHYLSGKGYDVLVWHYRSCSREMNRMPRFYEHGDITDLNDVITHVEGGYQSIVLLGFSMGGTMVVNYLGNYSEEKVKGGIAFSAPLDLADSAKQLTKGFNKQIEKSFLKKWKRKIRYKAEQFTDLFDLKELDKADSLENLHEKHVLPLHGYESMKAYYKKWSSLQYLKNVKVPLLIVNAKNDPMLSEHCYPYQLCEQNDHVYLETPRFGGHTGFTKKKRGTMWYLRRIEEFVQIRIL